MASSREGGIDLPSTARANDQKLAPERGSGRAKLARVRLGIRIGGVHEEADRSGFRDSFVQHLELLGGQQVGQKAHSGDIATRPVQAGNQSEFDWVTADGEDNRDGRGGGLRRQRHGGAAGDRNDGHLPAHELLRQRGRPVIVTFQPVKLDGCVSSLDPAGRDQAPAKPIHIARVGILRATAQEPDHRHRRRLRARRKRPCGCCATDEPDK